MVTGGKSAGATSSISPPLSSEQQEQKRKLMQEITQFTKALGQTSGGKESGNTGSNINAIRLRSGRIIPNATHVPTPYPSKRPEKELSESVETDDNETGTGIQQHNNPFVTTRNSSVAKKGSEPINTSSNIPQIVTRAPLTRSMKRAAEPEVRETFPHQANVDQELSCESGTDSGTLESVVPN